jgi:Tfp pilus assembly protein PilO
LFGSDISVKWRRVAVIAGTGLLCVYTVFALQGPHGIGALRSKLERIQDMHRKQSDLVTTVSEKRKRVKSLEEGQDIEMEMRRFGRTLPGEIEYKVAEPDVPSPDEDPKSGR